MKNDRKPKVGLVFDDSLDSNDGVAQYVKTLGAWLRGRGYDVRYLVGETKLRSWQGGQVYSLATNLGVRFNGNRLSMPLSSKKSQLRNVLDKEQFDILHVMTPYSPLMAQRLILMAGPKTAIVGTFHIFPSGRLSRFGSHLLRVVSIPSLRRFDGFASVSRPAQEFARQVYGIRSSVIPNPVDIKRFGGIKKAGAQRRIVFLGRLVERKGCRQLIEAFAMIQSDYPDCELVIAGDGPERKSLQKLAARLRISGRTHFLGYIDEKEKPELLGSAAIACFPSLYGESFGIVLIEAMASGARVVMGGNNPGYSSVLAPKPELLFDPRDIASFSEKLRLFLDDAALIRRVSGWQSEAVKQYDIDVVGAQVAGMYDDAIANRRQKSHNRHHE